MKKFVDRYLFSRFGLQVLFSVLVILLFSLVGTLLRSWVSERSTSGVYSQTFWGFRQITDGGSMAGTIDELDDVAAESHNGFAAPVLLAITLVSWLVGMVFYGFVAGAVANAFAGRKDKIAAGHVRYRHHDHGIVVGWDVQGVATVLTMLDRWKLAEVLVLSEQPAERIRGELSSGLDAKKLGHIFIYNGSAGNSDDLESICSGRAKTIVILGDQNETNNDGGNMRLSILIGDQIEREIKKSGCEPSEPIRMFVDVTGLHALRVARAHPKSDHYDDWPHVSVHIVNFFEEAAYDLFSSVSRLADGGECVSFRFRTNPDATHAHLVVAGFDEMARALVLHAARLLGCGSEPDCITVFSTDIAAMTRFRGAFPLDRLFGVHVEFVHADIADPSCAERLAAIAQDTTASVTLAVCAPTPDMAFELFSSLPRVLRFEKVRVVVEQRCMEKWTWTENNFRWMGFEDVNFFGFMNRYLASVDEREAVFRVLSPEKAKEAEYSEPAVAAAFLETAAVCRFAPQKLTEPHSFTDEELEQLACMAQNGRANGLLLDGREPSAVSAAGLFLSSQIRQWGNLSGADKEKIVDEWRKTIPVLAGFHAEAKQSLRIGILPSRRFLWRDEKEKADFVGRVGAADKKMRNDAKLGEKEPWPVGTILSADPSDPESLKFARWYAANHVRLDAVIPASVEECASRIADTTEREDFLQVLRCAWTVTIAPGGDVAACIRCRARIVEDL